MMLRRSFGKLTVAAGLAALLPPLAIAGSVEERVLGDPNAPVEIIEFSSLTCPHCAAFHTDTLPAIKEQYIDTGKAKLVSRDFPLNQPAVQAAVVAHCAGEERYFRFLDALFKNQRSWAQSGNVEEALVQFAKLGGLDESETRACLADESMTNAVLESRLEGSQQYDIQSTPTFVINGEVVSGNMDPDAFGELIEKHL